MKVSLFIIGAIALILFAIFFAPWLMRILWNDTLVKVFPVPEITFWQSFKLWLLSGFLFKGYNVVNESIRAMRSKHE